MHKIQLKFVAPNFRLYSCTSGSFNLTVTQFESRYLSGDHHKLSHLQQRPWFILFPIVSNNTILEFWWNILETCDISQARWWCRAGHVLLVIPFSERYKKTEPIRRWTHLRAVLCVNRASCKRFWWNILKKARKVKPVGGVDEWGYVFLVNPFGDKHKKKTAKSTSNSSKDSLVPY